MLLNELGADMSDCGLADSEYEIGDVLIGMVVGEEEEMVEMVEMEVDELEWGSEVIDFDKLSLLVWFGIGVELTEWVEWDDGLIRDGDDGDGCLEVDEECVSIGLGVMEKSEVDGWWWVEFDLS